MDRCETHNKQLKLVCLTCKQLICSNCIASSHNRHDIDDVLNIRQSLNEGRSRYAFRSKLLWDTIQALSTTYDELTLTKSVIANQFKELHELLVIQEHKLHSPINTELDKIQSYSKDIVKELIDIHYIVKLSSPPSPTSTSTSPSPSHGSFNHVHDDDADTEMDDTSNSTRLMRTIKSSPSLDHFIKVSTESNIDMATLSEDIQLLRVVQQSAHTLETSYPLRKIQSSHFEYDRATMDRIKADLQFAFKLCSLPMINAPSGYKGHLITNSNRGVSLFSPQWVPKLFPQSVPWTWKDLLDKETDPYRCFKSMVYGRGNVHIFDAGVYTKASLPDLNKSMSLPVKNPYLQDKTVACYNGHCRIYMIGGNTRSEHINYLDIDTGKFGMFPKTVPALPLIPYTFFHRGKIFIAGGIVNGAGYSPTIITVDTQTLQVETLIKADWLNRMSGCCFDGNDTIYLIVKDGFYSLSLSTLAYNKLAPKPSASTYNCLHYIHNQGIVHVGPFGEHGVYSITNNKWIVNNSSEIRVDYLCLIGD
ncbi:hypothetical protein SAMD00019534_063450 [Acytostelium subglobosum LB1]|uniref:hypothetical protein n=1 Tax=Acytostelium subglobosum LB1 TaxID=1410327 RepID=UPI000644C8C4|nr:hypothetical protein SAMD00019534_063450 [Acytostelium subglobosum LB1]GAM23170.1 hypothetical protein SAMD00019534_063450 [Acytostelium subglobosum LB1]|eukprot:XP_012753619.1 hypothetical protein SAMD00019534_063450 [Acytostelium subglobosum LB1]